MALLPEPVRCPDCGTELVSAGDVAGLCPQCRLSLALAVSPPDDEPGEAPTLEGPAPGRLLGQRYQIRELLGRGGMGEVYRAFDLKLRVDVALKAVRPGRAEDGRVRELLRREVRSAREVVSPNVCRIFDLVDEDGQELLSMEYVDGETLAAILRERGPLALKEAREIASQFLSGLEAIHQAGLVHRDFKPENVMLTRAGRVVVMDFGVARSLEDSGRGTVSGTPAYMAPEQARGDALDARADVYAAALVLAEMLSVGGPGAFETRQALWRAARETPPRVPEGAWAGVLRQALDPRPEGRPASARALALALEQVTERLPGIEDKRPYPGLTSFTQADAEYFFGRELETEAVWKKLKRPRLLALIGPSGAGKSSFLRAGLLPALPAAWQAVLATPGKRPFQALAQALVPHFAGDTDTLQALVRFEDADTAVAVVSRWRQRHEQALVIVDQFEELFTQNPQETQAAFARLLGRLVLEADAHVVLSLRDDFLIHCHAHDALGPAFSDLTPLGPLGESALRRALVQPALECGYRFEADALVEEMVQAVRGERGALPLLAFAASRLWELRDRERGLLTWDAYRQVGGVAGALAQHAEATLERIGAPRTPLVRELFRNLVTAQGTRAVQGRAELLSVFAEAERGAAGEVLAALVDARLLTEYERAGEGGESRQTVEIVHESLLGAWPRLVRWRTQDEAGAQLRDQLRQAARLWEERGRAEDLLWTGPSFREYALWKERHPQPLTALEDDYARAMTARATRQRRLRRLVAAGLVAAAAAVAIVMSVLWARSERARTAAVAEARQREAAQILSLGRLRLDDHPSAALAHAIASLERADNAAARRMAVEALWKGQPVLVETEARAITPMWSSDGRWLALGATTGLTLLDRDTGRRQLLGTSGERPVGFSADETRLVSRSQAVASELHLWSLPDGRLLETWPPAERLAAALRDRRLLTIRFDDTNPPADRAALVHERSLDGGSEKLLGRWRPRGLADFRVDSEGERLFSLQGGRILEQRLDALEAPPRVLGRHDGAVRITDARNGRFLTAAASGEVRIWDAATGRVERTLRSPAQMTRRAGLAQSGRFIAAAPGDSLPPGSFVLFDLQAPRVAEAVRLAQKEVDDFTAMAFHPQGGWLASGHAGTILLWNLRARRSTVLRGQKGVGIALAFTRDGRLVSTSDEGVVRLWSLDPDASEPVRELWSEPRATIGGALQVDARDRFAVFSKHYQGQVFVQPLDGSRARQLSLGGRRPAAVSPELDASGERIAVTSFEFGNPDAGSIRLLDLASGEERVLRVKDTAGACAKALARFGPAEPLVWLPDGRLVSEGFTGLRVWNLADGSSRQVRPCRPSMEAADTVRVSATPEGRELVTLVSPGTSTAGASDLYVTDLTTGISRDITSHGTRLQTFALDRTGTLLVTGDADGLVRVGPFSGEEPHLLYGHARAVTGVAVSPDGKWIASGSDDDTIRLWPMPDGPPLHTLPYDALLAKLRALTNLRVEPDAASATGYKVKPGPFPGWANVPEW